MLEPMLGAGFWEFAKEYGWKGVILAVVSYLAFKIVCKIIDMLPSAAVWVGKVVLLPIRDRIIQHFETVDAAIVEGRENFRKVDTNVIGIHTKMDTVTTGQIDLSTKFDTQEDLLDRIATTMESSCPVGECPFRSKLKDLRKEIKDEKDQSSVIVAAGCEGESNATPSL